MLYSIEDVQKRDVMKEAVSDKLNRSLSAYESNIYNNFTKLTNKKTKGKKLSMSINRRRRK